MSGIAFSHLLDVSSMTAQALRVLPLNITSPLQQGLSVFCIEYLCKYFQLLFQEQFIDQLTCARLQ